MPLPDITKPATLLFLIENYEKETKQRLLWNRKHQEQIEEAATFHRPPKNYNESDITTYKMVAGLATTTRDHIETARHKRKILNLDDVPREVKNLRKRNAIVEVGLGDPIEDPRLAKLDIDIPPKMRPVDLKLEELLQQSIPEGGRKQYLLQRADIFPENKYYFTECTSWEYGWRLGDSAMKQISKFGSHWHLNRALKSRVGVQPDPPHYKSADIPGPYKCPE